MKKIGIIDFKLGNLFSVEQACKTVGLEVQITSDPNEILSFDGIILPGVGAFGDAMSNLNGLDLVTPIKDFVDSGKPFMGICLGFQLLFSESEEFGDNKGIGLLDGEVRRFDNTFNSKMKVPQIGWNKIYSDSNWGDTPLAHVTNNEFMYFVHSFYVQPAKNDFVLTKTNYEGKEYCSSIKKDNIFATQFHPEKSGELGIEIYRNWSKLL
jgi:glutamine amidotransferase